MNTNISGSELDAEAQNLKNNTVILMSHLGAHLAVPGFFNILQGQTK